MMAPRLAQAEVVRLQGPADTEYRVSLKAIGVRRIGKLSCQIEANIA